MLLSKAEQKWHKREVTPGVSMGKASPQDVVGSSLRVAGPKELSSR